MTPIRNLLSDAVRNGLAAGTVGLVGLASASAFAQNAPAPAPSGDKAKNLDRVEVIGTKIRRVDTEPTQPVTTLTRADIEQTGLTTTFDIINHISASDGSGLSTVTTQTNGSDGSQTVSLRDLGAQRTLVLVDGKRWPTDANGIVDLSSIPVAIIERIEVLKDGASAIYGSDAVAGVINIITRKKYEGAQIGWFYGETSHGDGEQNSEDVTIGASGERSSGVLALSRSEQGTIFAADRTISEHSIFGCAKLLSNWPASDPSSEAGYCGSSTGQFGRITLSNSQARSIAGLPRLDIPIRNSSGTIIGYVSEKYALDNSFFDSGNASGNPATATATASGMHATDFHNFTPLDRYNFAPVNYLQQPATRNNLFMSGRFDITDNITAYVRASYTQRQSSQQLAQVPATFAESGANGPQWKFGVAGDTDLVNHTGGNIFNPFINTAGNKVEVRTGQLRMVAVGPRHNNYDFNTIGATGGVQGNFNLGDRNFDWDVYAQFNNNRNTKVGENFINLFNLAKALGPSFADAGGLHCGAPGAVISGCVPFNIFGGPTLGVGNQYTRRDDPTKKYTVTAQDVANMIRYVGYTQVATNQVKGINYGGNLSGDVMPLPGGRLSFATGFESRRTTAFFQPDTLVASGGSSDNFTEPTSGHTKVDEWYVELNAVMKDLPIGKELELDGALRKSRYSAGGRVGTTDVTSSPGNPANSKFSVRWRPFNDLVIRGSYGRTFRAPSVNDLFAGGAENFPAASDPCRTTRWAGIGATAQAICTAQGVPTGGVLQDNTQLRALSGGNPDLKPEHGHNLTYGFVWSPSWGMLNGLGFTADYWRISLHDGLATLGAQTILNDCFFGVPGSITAGDPQYCNKVERVPGGAVSAIRTAQFNITTLKVSGIDFGVTDKWETSRWGTFGLKWDTTYVKHEEFGGADFVGVYTGSPNWKWRSVATLDWKRGDWDAAWTIRYTSHLDEAGGCNVNVQNSQPLICNHPNSQNTNPLIGPLGLGYNRIGATTYHDVQVGWRAPWKAHLSVGARNIFGKEPPLVNSTFAQSFDASYDLPGGPFWYFQYRQDF